MLQESSRQENSSKSLPDLDEEIEQTRILQRNHRDGEYNEVL